MLCYLHALVSQCQPTSNKDSDQDAIQTSGDNLVWEIVLQICPLLNIVRVHCIVRNYLLEHLCGTVINYGSGTVIKWNHKSCHSTKLRIWYPLFKNFFIHILKQIWWNL